MDLTSIREDLRGDNYNTPVEFCEDVRRVFHNAQTFSEVHPDEKVCFLSVLLFILVLLLYNTLHCWVLTIRTITYYNYKKL